MTSGSSGRYKGGLTLAKIRGDLNSVCMQFSPDYVTYHRCMSSVDIMANGVWVDKVSQYL